MSFGNEFCRTAIVSFCLLAGTGSLRAQKPVVPPDTSGKQVPFSVEHADRFFQHRDSVSGISAYTLQGAVEVSRGNSRIRCASLTYYPDSQYFLSLDSVQVTDTLGRLESDSLFYYVDRDYYRAVGRVRWQARGVSGRGNQAEYFRDRKLLRLTGSAQAEDSLRRLDAAELEYDTGTEVLRAGGNVRMRDMRSGSTAQAASAVYYRSSGAVTLSGRPEVAYYEPGDSVSPYHIIADLLRRYGPDSLVAVGRVRLWRDSLTITADSLFHNLTTGVSYFRGGPPGVTDPRYSLRGEAIDVTTLDRRLRRVTAIGQSRGEFYADSSSGGRDSLAGPAQSGSWISGDTLELNFGRSGIDSISASGSSRSYFRENPSASINYVLGQRILLVWESGVIARVQVEGGGRGLFVQPDTSRQTPASADSARGGKTKAVPVAR